MILIVEDQYGDLDLRNHRTLRSFPLRRVRGSLWLGGCKLLRSLPDAFEAGWYLDLDECPSLTKLPTTLRVGWTLWLQNTSVTELPEGLVVGMDLYLQGSKVTHVPQSARIGGQVWELGEP